MDGVVYRVGKKRSLVYLGGGKRASTEAVDAYGRPWTGEGNVGLMLVTRTSDLPAFETVVWTPERSSGRNARQIRQAGK